MPPVLQPATAAACEHARDASCQCAHKTHRSKPSTSGSYTSNTSVDVSSVICERAKVSLRREAAHAGGMPGAGPRCDASEFQQR